MPKCFNFQIPILTVTQMNKEEIFYLHLKFKYKIIKIINVKVY